MISRVILSQVMTELSTAIGIPIVRANQRGEKPKYPYGTWFPVQQQGESAYMHAMTYADGGTGVALISSYEKHRQTISLNFMDQDDPDSCISNCASAIRYFTPPSTGIDFLSTLGLVAKIVSPDAQDRTAYLETSYETKWGFDFRIDTTERYQSTGLAIEQVSVSPSTGTGLPFPDFDLFAP